MAKPTDPLHPSAFLYRYQSTRTTGDWSTPSSYITWRALVPTETGLVYRLRKLPAQFLPERFVAELRSENSKGRAAQEQGDFKTAMEKFVTCRTLISEDLRKIVPEHVQKQDYDFLLAWADLPLAQLCQSLGSSDPLMFKEGMDMWKEPVLD